ncbi:Mth938-like domain-containing protein [Salipiger mucosus]|nr:Mth938-like domain-containing protein [Salipiger mucosus]
MRMNEITYSDAQPVEGYGPGFFRVGGKALDGPLCVSASGPKHWGGFDDEEPLLSLAGQVDVLFVGTGDDVAHLPNGLKARLEEAGVGYEVMNSPSACRTFNVLLAEGRRVALAVLPV